MSSIRPSVSLLATVLAAALAGGCSKKTAPAGEPGGAPSANAAVASTSPATAAPGASAAAGLGLADTTLAERLAREARNRPPIQPNADDVLAAFAKLGAVVATKHQGLGATYKASFCEGGTTSDGAITLSVCEYPDEASAKTGLAAVSEIFPAKAAEHLLHKDTVLTLLRLKDGSDVQAQQAKLAAAYKTL